MAKAYPDQVRLSLVDLGLTLRVEIGLNRRMTKMPKSAREPRSGNRGQITESMPCSLQVLLLTYEELRHDATSVVWRVASLFTFKKSKLGPAHTIFVLQVLLLTYEELRKDATSAVWRIN